MPRQAVDYVGAQVGVDPSRFGEYQWSGRTIEYHRAMRAELGFRVATRDDEAKLTRWLAEEVARDEHSDGRLKEVLRAGCRTVRIKPPGRLECIGQPPASRPPTRSVRTMASLPVAVPARLEALADGDPSDWSGPGPLAELRSAPAG